MSTTDAPPPPPPPTEAKDGPQDQGEKQFKMEIIINRKGEAEVKTTPISGPAPSSALQNANLEYVTDDKWKALLRKFVDQQRRTGTLPDDETQHELHLWYLHAVREYGNSRSHRKSTLSKHQVMLLEEEAGFAFPRSAAAASANQVQEDKAEAGSTGGGAGSTGGGGSSPRIRIKIPKVGAASGMGSNNSRGGGLGSNTSSRRSTPKGLTPKGSTPKIADTPMDVDDEASFPSVAPELLVADDLPIVGVTMTPAQHKALEETPPDAATMAVLVRRFAKLLARQQYQHNSAVNLDHAVALLGVPKNRLMEIVEILEGAGLVKFMNGEEGGSVEWLGAEGMLEQTDQDGEESEVGAAAKKRKREDAGTLREEIGKLYHEESVLDAWIHRCEALPHYTDRPFLYCKAGDIVRAAQKGPDGKPTQDITRLVTLAIRAPPGGVLEVTDPDQTVIGTKKRRYQLSVTNKTEIAALPLPPPPAADSNFNAANFKASLKESKIDMGETCGVGGISGNPVQVYHLCETRVPTGGNAMDLDGREEKASVILRKIDVHTNLKGGVVGPVGFGIGSISGIVTPEMIMNANVRYDSDTLCLREDEGASTFFA